jgi:hypothetical protein
MADLFQEKLANIERAKQKFIEAKAEGWAWTDEVRAAVLRGEMPERLEPRGEPLLRIENALRLSSFAGFDLLVQEVRRQQAQARTSGEVVKRATERMGELIGEAAAPVEVLLQLAVEADALYRVVTAARMAWQQAGTPIPAADGHAYENRTGPRMQPKPGGVTAGDLVDLVLDPRSDPFALEEIPMSRHLSFGAGLGGAGTRDDERGETVEQVRDAHAARQHAERLGITRGVRLVPGFVAKPPEEEPPAAS